jgi:hypothetical protein
MAVSLLASFNESSDTTILEPSPSKINRGFQERKETVLRCDEPGEWELYIDDERIPNLRSGSSTSWRWSPKFFAGTVAAELIEKQGQSATQFLLDVSPDPSKLGQKVFNQMVEEICEFDIGMILGNEPATMPIGKAGNTENPAIRLLRMMRHRKALLSALRSIEEQPDRTIRQSRVLVNPSGLRKVDAQTIRSFVTSGAAFSMRSTSGGLSSLSIKQPFFDVPISEETMDTPANRALLALMNALVASAKRIIARFDKEAERESDEFNTPMKDRWPRRKAKIDKFLGELAYFRDRNPLRAVTRPEFSSAGLTALSANPRYARARSVAWDILRPGFSGSSTQEISWMSPTWHIYEAWCMVRLCKAFRDGIPELEWREHRDKSADYYYEGTQEDRRLVLQYQPTFIYEQNSNKSEYQSVSAEFRPDVVISIDGVTSKRWMVLDAKYSCSRQSILTQIRSAHIYHDALRRGDRPPDMSLLMVPTSNAEPGWLQDISFHEAHGVGVTAFSPDHAFEKRLLAMARNTLGLEP